MVRMLIAVGLVALFALTEAARPAIHRPGIPHQNILRCKASMETVKFMWDSETPNKFPGWFTITNISSDAPSRRNSNSPMP